MSTAAIGVSAYSRPPRRVFTRTLAVLLCAAGWWISIDLLKISGGAASSSPLLAPFCGATDGGESDCVSVLRSPQAYAGRTRPDDPRPSGGIPWAALGAGYFACVGAWFLFVGSPSRGRWWMHVPLVAVVAYGALMSAHLLNVMFYELHRTCAGCLAVHAINFGLALLALASFPWKRESAPATPHPRMGHFGAAACASLALLMLHAQFATSQMTASNARAMKSAFDSLTGDSSLSVWHYQKQSPRDVPLFEGEAVGGRADAPHTLIVYADYECSRCREAHRVVRDVQSKYAGRLRVVYRNYPLHTACNPNETRTLHASACDAARAMIAAQALGGADAVAGMRELLYENQSDISAARLVDWAVGLGLDRAAFQQALQSAATADLLRRDVESAKALGVTKAPTLLLDGRLLELWQNADWATLLGDAPAAAAPSSGPTVAATPTAPPSKPSGAPRAARNPAAELQSGEDFEGPAAAPHTIVAYIDYQCRGCLAGHMILQAVLQKYPGAARVAYRNFPLDTSCNHSREQNTHPQACAAARAAAAARIAGGFEGFRKVRDALFQRPSVLQNGTYVDLARELKLDADAFDAALQSSEPAALLQMDIESGMQLGIDGTPAFFVDGQPLAHWNKLDLWDALMSGKAQTVQEAVEQLGLTDADAPKEAPAAPASRPSRAAAPRGAAQVPASRPAATPSP